MTIVIKKRNDGYIAYFDMHLDMWEYGDTEAEAIGKLIITYEYTIGVKLVRK